MKQPNLKNLKINLHETKKIREVAAAAKKTKITVNIDSGVLLFLKKESKETGTWAKVKEINQL